VQAFPASGKRLTMLEIIVTLLPLTQLGLKELDVV
jgi:hypothetical protein